MRTEEMSEMMMMGVVPTQLLAAMQESSLWLPSPFSD